MMRHFKQLLLICGAGLMMLTSCVDDYKLPDAKTEPMMVVSGQIVANTDCRFTLHTTLTPSGEALAYMNVKDAKVTVHGTDGQTFEGRAVEDEYGNQTGEYMVSVGTLDPAAKYYVSISSMYGDYESQPMQPLDAPDIEAAYYEQPRDDKKVDIIVTTANPQQAIYLLWQLDEYWEIYTPLIAHWEYKLDPGNNLYDNDPKGSYAKVADEALTNHGWRHDINLSAIGSNEDYGNGAITQRCIYQKAYSDMRFQTRYCARIQQMAITREEYEYRKLLKQQTTNVGGLFNAMPAELPSNIVSHGEMKVLGYVGVRGRISQKDVYINGSDVGHINISDFYISEEEATKSPIQLLRSGYVVYIYSPDAETIKWTYPWCVDYRDEHWGGYEGISRPDFWIDR